MRDRKEVAEKSIQLEKDKLLTVTEKANTEKANMKNANTKKSKSGYQERSLFSYIYITVLLHCFRTEYQSVKARAYI